MTTTRRTPRRPEVFDVSATSRDHDVRDWERHNAAALVGLSCDVPEATSFRAREVNLQLDRVHLARVHGTPHAVVRNRAMVSRRPDDAVVVYAALRGSVEWVQAGTTRVVRPGQLVVCDVDRPFARRFARGLEELAVKVPREALTELTGPLALDTPVVVDTSGGRADPHARALVRVVGRAVGRSAVPADERTVLELVSVVAGRGAVGPRVAHRAAARAFIDDHLTDPSLTAADVAAGVGISERHLSRLFAESGCSIPRHVLTRRLDLAHSRLCRPDTRQDRVVDIAASCGFTSMPYFADAFKRRFEATAGEVRRAAEERPPVFRRGR